MSFALLSFAAVAAGAAALAIALWLAQRLRVEHREVEVLSTLFWQEALQETRARVFVRRFRHWWAWALLVLIASLLWLLLAIPQTHSLDGTRHILLVDWSAADPQVRENDLALAIIAASRLPTQDREIIAVGTTLETLLRPGEQVELARLRSGRPPDTAPPDLGWAIEALAARATNEVPLSIHIIGDAPIEQTQLDAVLAQSNGDAKPKLTIGRMDRAPISADPMLATLGVADSVLGRWDLVDLWIAPASGNKTLSDAEISIKRDGSPVETPLTLRDDGILELRGLAADGSTIQVAMSDRMVGSIPLPRRTAIRVRLEAEVPETLRQLIALDNACEIVDADADVTVGLSADADFRLSGDQEPAFGITTEDADAEGALSDLVDRLALEQIDATGIAETSGRVVDVQVTAGKKRSIAVWSNLFTPAFDFRESRACPVLVARSIRWLADRQTLIPWAQLGQRLPESSPTFARAIESKTLSEDGQTVLVSRLAPTLSASANLAESKFGSFFFSISPLTWLGLLAAMLLIGEWVLYQRGQIP